MVPMSSKPKLTYEVEERCCIYLEVTKPPLSGMVLTSFTTPYALDTYYIIMIDDPDHPHFEVRNALNMAPAPDAPPPIHVNKAALARALERLT